MTVGEILIEMEATMQSDKFWADLARPLESARAVLREGAADAQESAFLFLCALREQLDRLKSESKSMFMFTEEKETIKSIITRLKDDSQPAMTLDTVLPGITYTRSVGHGTSDKAAKKVQALNNKVSELNHDKKPWEFREVQDEIEVQVSIQVPPDTKKGDVKVTITSSSLRVAVSGHEHQPYVIDGELVGQVDAESSGWSLDGSGDKRKLAIDLEKKMGGF